MRPLRRFAIALLGVLLLQVTPLGAGAPCAASSGDVALSGGGLASASAARAGTADVAPDGVARDDAAHDHTGHSRPVRAPATDAPLPGHGPMPQHHGGEASCPSAAACTNVATADATPGITPPRAHAGSGLAPLDVLMPASPVGPPEPAPPRVRP